MATFTGFACAPNRPYLSVVPVFHGTYAPSEYVVPLLLITAYDTSHLTAREPDHETPNDVLVETDDASAGAVALTVGPKPYRSFSAYFAVPLLSASAPYV